MQQLLLTITCSVCVT